MAQARLQVAMLAKSPHETGCARQECAPAVLAGAALPQSLGSGLFAISDSLDDVIALVARDDRPSHDD